MKHMSRCTVSMKETHKQIVLAFLRCLTSNKVYVFVQIKYGEVTYDTTFEDYTMLTGKLCPFPPLPHSPTLTSE